MATTVFVAVVLLSLGLSCLALAGVARRHSVHHGGKRTIALVSLGVAALAGMLIVLASQSWSSVRSEMLWPLTVYLSGALAGTGLGLTLVYGLVSAR